MSVIVTDQGFAQARDDHPPVALEALATDPGARAVDLPPSADALAVVPLFDRLDLIRIAFPAFSDGRGFTLARRLRRLGYRGRLRAAGHLIADQYAMARRAGFDEVEIPAALAERQPWPQWQARADWRAHDYRSRLIA
jgi:uncharacterized protein (DUF934 family)